jgi:hypothetical protein
MSKLSFKVLIEIAWHINIEFINYVTPWNPLINIHPNNTRASIGVCNDVVDEDDGVIGKGTWWDWVDSGTGARVRGSNREDGRVMRVGSGK